MLTWSLIDERSSYKFMSKNSLLKNCKRSKTHKQNCSDNSLDGTVNSEKTDSYCLYVYLDLQVSLNSKQYLYEKLMQIED